jgi:hypothetical protein
MHIFLPIIKMQISLLLSRFCKQNFAVENDPICTKDSGNSALQLYIQMFPGLKLNA